MRRDLGFGEVKWLVWGHVLVTAGLGLEYSAAENSSFMIFPLESCIKKRIRGRSPWLKLTYPESQCGKMELRMKEPQALKSPFSAVLSAHFRFDPAQGGSGPMIVYTHPLGLLSWFHFTLAFPAGTGVLFWPPGFLHWSPGIRLLPWVFSPGKLKSSLFASMLRGVFITLDRSATESDANFPLWLLLLQETASWTHFIEHLLHTRHNPELIPLSSLSKPNETLVCHEPLENVLCATVD